MALRARGLLVPRAIGGASALFPRAVPRRGILTFGKEGRPHDNWPTKEGTILHSLHNKARETFDLGWLYHFSRVMALGAAVTTDWAILRTALIASGSANIVFNFIWPDPRPVRMGWAALFVTIHSMQLARYLHEHRAVELDKDQAELYAQLFKQHGFSEAQFLKLLEKAEIVTLQDGEHVVEEGKPIEYITVVIEGEARWAAPSNAFDGVKANPGLERVKPKRTPSVLNAKDMLETAVRNMGRGGSYKMGYTKAGGIIGEFWNQRFRPGNNQQGAGQDRFAKDDGDGVRIRRWRATATAQGAVRVIRWPRNWLHECISASEHLRAAAAEMQLEEMWRVRWDMAEEMMNAERERRLKELWSEFDQDGNGVLSRQELSAALRGSRAGMGELSESEMEHAMSTADVDGDGNISFDEFLVLIGVVEVGTPRHQLAVQHAREVEDAWREKQEQKQREQKQQEQKQLEQAQQEQKPN